MRKPAKDTQLRQDGALQIEAFAVDDYGVAEARLQVRLPQGTQTRELPVKPVEREKEFFGSVSIDALQLQVGDIFSYFVEVGDNKRPEAQWSRSGVYFVEIIPPEQEPEEGQDGPDPKEIPLRNLINSNKQLIRETYIGMGLEGADRQAQNLKVATDAHKLKNDLNRLYDENKEKLGGPLGEMLQQATSSVENAEKAAAKGELDESLAFSENSLRTLVRMSAMLRKPPPKVTSHKSLKMDKVKANKPNLKNPRASHRNPIWLSSSRRCKRILLKPSNFSKPKRTLILGYHAMQEPIERVSPTKTFLISRESYRVEPKSLEIESMIARANLLMLNLWNLPRMR